MNNLAKIWIKMSISLRLCKKVKVLIMKIYKKLKII